MAITYAASVKNARLSAVVTEIGATGVLEIGTSEMATVLATLNLDSVAGSVANGVLTFSSFPKSGNASDAGVAQSARVRTAVDGSDVITGLSVGTSGCDINLDVDTIVAGQVVTINSVQITHG